MQDEMTTETAPASEAGLASGKASEPTLAQVIRDLPKSVYENPTWKGLWYFFRDGLMYLAMVAALLATDNPLYLIPLWAVAALVLSALFIIGHDAGHRALFKSRKVCDIIGKIAMLPSFHNYSAWLLGHNRVHHGFTVHQERDFVWHPTTTEEYAAMTRWGKFMHRLEWSCFGAGIYYMIEVWWKKMIAFRPPEKLAPDFRKDARFLLLGLLGGLAFFFAFTIVSRDHTLAGSLAYTAWLAVKVMLIPWVGFNYVIGAVVYLHHINPDLKWHEHETWTKFRAQMEGTMIYRVSPRALNIFLHDIMIHVPHHVDARIPFYNLNKAAAHIHANYPEVVRDVVLRLSDYIRATRRCKLYDFDAQVWTDYKGRIAAGFSRPPLGA